MTDAELLTLIVSHTRAVTKPLKNGQLRVLLRLRVKEAALKPRKVKRTPGNPYGFGSRSQDLT